jgi:diacylglycerol O-acyltransferase
MLVPQNKQKMPRHFLPFVDQGMYLAHAHGGQQAVIQLLWLYRRPVNRAALTIFRDNLARGRLARLIQPARLPFGRHTWVSAPPPSAVPDMTAKSIEPNAFQAWADAQVELPIDPVHGPAWTCTVQPFQDGSTAVSLVVSHCVADGMATALAVREAARGEQQPLGYFPRPARRSAAALGAEFSRTLRDAPETLRALARLARTLRQSQRTSPVPLAQPAADTRMVALPWTSMRLPISEWDAKARSLGANRLTLLTAITAAFAEGLGRISNGDVTLLIPVNQREGLSDAGGNCVSIATLKVPTGEPYGRLHALQRRLQATLLRTRREPDPLAALLPLVPFVPKRAFLAAGQLALGALAELPVTCSFVGEWSTDVLKIDGDEADRFCFRGTDRQVSARAIEARQGVASIPACVISDFLVLNFVAYQPGRVTNHHQIRELAKRILASYGLAGEYFDE